ncbi:acylphosphatase [Candidatus Poribacteria bacterium]|nr:MAG: acylphosphatase [Candidatus Poribacteria bacterium]
MSDKIGAHIIIKGIVQGVGFRWFLRGVAQRLGLGGWVRNLPNGDVEAMVEGERKSVMEFIDWCRVGPPSARVDDVQVKTLPYTGKYKTFSITF